jgi:thioredoxin reductase (NADPH)
MVTAEEIALVPIFSGLDRPELERLSRVAADITLLAGEYAAHLGDERALFAVLEGRIEPIRLEDGMERPVGERLPGDLFGEVPVTLGTVFPVGFRAAERSRVLRIEPRDYHALAAAVPDIAREVGRLASHRMGGARGLSGLTAEQRPPRATVVGPRSDPATNEVRRFLDRNQVSYEWLDPGTAEAEERWGGPLPADEDCPTIRVVDGGRTIVRPELRRLAELLGLRTEPHGAAYQVVVVGAGPAGLAAAVYGASEGLRTIVVERAAPGGQAGTSSRIENYLGFPGGVPGDELMHRALRQSRKFDAEILVTRSIERIDAEGRQVYLDGGEVLRAETIILACGVTWRQLTIEGFERLTGKGIFYGAMPSDAQGTHGLDVHVLGAGNSAGQAALSFSGHARSVAVLCRGDSLEKSMSRYLVDQLVIRPNIEIRMNTEAVAAYGDTSLEAIDVRNSLTGETTRLDSGGIYIFIGADAETDWLPAEIARDSRGYVLTGADAHAAGRWELDRDPYLLETSVPGVFACGDVRFSPVKRVAAAVGEGSMAIAFVHQYLKDVGSPA